MFRYLSAQTERRHPKEQHAFDVWLAHRPDVLRRALLECAEIPSMEQQVENIERAMTLAFDETTAVGDMHDINELMTRTMEILKREWVPNHIPSLVKPGNQPLPILDEPATRKNLEFKYMR